VNIVVGRLLNVTINIGTFPVSVISDAHPSGVNVCSVKLIISLSSSLHQKPSTLILQLNSDT
jgi:hypothetical protein